MLVIYIKFSALLENGRKIHLFFEIILNELAIKLIYILPADRYRRDNRRVNKSVNNEVRFFYSRDGFVEMLVLIPQFCFQAVDFFQEPPPSPTGGNGARLSQVLAGLSRG